MSSKNKDDNLLSAVSYEWKLDKKLEEDQNSFNTDPSSIVNQFSSSNLVNTSLNQDIKQEVIGSDVSAYSEVSIGTLFSDQEINFLGFNYEHVDNSDFLSSFEEENIPYLIKKNDNLDGNIYKLLADTMSESDEIVLDYDFRSDKIDLNDFTDKYGSVVDYNISKIKDGLEINLEFSDKNLNITLAGNVEDDYSNELNMVLTDFLSKVS